MDVMEQQSLADQHGISNEAKIVRFDDGDHIMEMEVNKGDVSYCSSESEEDDEEIDHEVSFKESHPSSEDYETSSSETETRSESESRSTSPRENERPSSDVERDDYGRARKKKKVTPKSTPNRSRSEKLRDLDAEITEKLQELQSLMEEGGLDGSASLIAKQLLPKLTKSTSVKEGEQINTNSNSVHVNKGRKIKKGMNGRGSCSPSFNPRDLLSEETIYERAVPSKRGSSSSEDNGLIDTSDEIITVEFNNLNVTSPKVAETTGSRRDS